MSESITIQGRYQSPRVKEDRQPQVDATSFSRPIGGGSIVVSPSLVRQKKSAPRVFRRTIRRMRGFLIGFEGMDAKVAFIVEGKPVEYFLPAKFLTKNKITATAQPFEMDEYEERSKGQLSTGTSFRPIAPASSGRSKSVDLDEEQLKLRDAILAGQRF